MEEYLTFDDVGLVPSYSCIKSRLDTDISVNIAGVKYNYPLIPANMDTVISEIMLKEIIKNGGLSIYHRFTSTEERLYIGKTYNGCFLSIGTSSDEKRVIDILISEGIKNFCIDVAHGHSEEVLSVLKYIRGRVPDSVLIAGNVCTYEGYIDLANAGADIIKVGVGPGSACTTRMKTGFGVPQFSAIQNCVKAKKSLQRETWLIADGGIRHPKDVALALGAGADMVMMGNAFAKTFESAGKKYIYDKKCGYIEILDVKTLSGSEELYSHYRGQASSDFMNSYYKAGTKVRVAEGVSYYTKCTGSFSDVLGEYTGSLRSSLTYAGTDKLSDFSKNVKFFRASSTYLTESNHREGQ